MAEEPKRTNADPGPAARRPRARLRWWFAALGAGLLVAEAAAKSRSGRPFSVSILDALVLVALAVVIGTYVILVRAEREQAGAGSDEGGAPADEPPA